RREVGGVTLLGLLVGAGRVQGASVLGHEQEQQPVDHAQQCAVQGLGVQVLAQMRVGRVFEEAGAQDGDGFLHPLAQLVQGAASAGWERGAGSIWSSSTNSLNSSPSTIASRSNST